MQKQYMKMTHKEMETVEGRGEEEKMEVIAKKHEKRKEGCIREEQRK